jgi:hypothetical protein
MRRPEHRRAERAVCDPETSIAETDAKMIMSNLTVFNHALEQPYGSRL